MSKAEHYQEIGSVIREKRRARNYDLPTVSVVVINYNYGAYVSKAVESVMLQSYPLVECIVIDDVSTDDSRSIIEGLCERYKSLKTLFNEKNMGQSASIAHAIEQCAGEYIIFLDADDFMLPSCVEAHVIAHMSLRMPVGFTSVDMLQIVGGQAITTAFPCFANYMQETSPSKDHVRYLDVDLGDDEDPILTRDNIDALVRYVPPQDSGGWPWSPTSGNCFRREALRLVMRNEAIAPLRSCTDCYMLRGVACLTGSALIDIPLVGYRLHKTNDFVRGSNLHHIMPYESANLKLRSNQATKLLVDYLVDNAAFFVGRLEAPAYYREALDALDHVHPPICDDGPSYTTRKLIASRDKVSQALGKRVFDEWMAARLLPGNLIYLPVVGGWIVSAFAAFGLPRVAEQHRLEPVRA